MRTCVAVPPPQSAQNRSGLGTPATRIGTNFHITAGNLLFQFIPQLKIRRLLEEPGHAFFHDANPLTNAVLFRTCQ